MTTSPIRLVDETGIERFRGTQSPGGGSSPVQMARVVVTNAEILTLPTAPVELIAAPASGTAIVPMLAFLVGNQVGTPYANIDATAVLFLCFNGDEGLIALDLVAETVGGLVTQIINGGGGSDTLTVSTTQSINGGSTCVGAFLSGTQIDGLPLTLVMDNSSSGDLTAGDPGSSLAVTVLYALLSTSPS